MWLSYIFYILSIYSPQYICGSSDELLRDICRDITEYNPDWIVENTYKGIDWGSSHSMTNKIWLIIYDSLIDDS